MPGEVLLLGEFLCPAGFSAKKDPTSHCDGPCRTVASCPALQCVGVSQPPKDATGWHQPPPTGDFKPKFLPGSRQHLIEHTLHRMRGWQQGNDVVSA